MTLLRRGRPSPALVVAVLALVAALAGTAIAEVATTARLDKKEKKQTRKIARKVSQKQINKQFPIGENQIADGAVSTDKIGDGAVSNSKLEHPLLSAVVQQNGNLARGVGATSSTQLATGLYQTNFDRDLSGCSWVAQIGSPNGVPVASGEVSTSLRSPDPADSQSLLHIVNGSNGVVQNRPFHVHVYC